MTLLLWIDLGQLSSYQTVHQTIEPLYPTACSCMQGKSPSAYISAIYRIQTVYKGNENGDMGITIKFIMRSGLTSDTSVSYTCI